MKNSYKSKKTKTIEQIPCFLKDGSKREDPTKIRREDGVCVKKKCDSSDILNPETGECIDKSTKKGKKLSENKGIDDLFSNKNLKEIQDNRYKQSKPKRKKRNTKPSDSIMRKPCRDGQIRNPVTGRCKFVKKNTIPDVKPNPEPEEPKTEEPNKPKRKKRNTKPSDSIMRKPCRDGQIRNPVTGRCKLIPDLKPNPEPKEPKTEERRLEKIRNEEKKTRIISNVKPREVKININNNNGFGDSSLNSLFTLSEKDMVNNHLMEDQEVPEIIRRIRFSTN